MSYIINVYLIFFYSEDVGEALLRNIGSRTDYKALFQEKITLKNTVLFIEIFYFEHSLFPSNCARSTYSETQFYTPPLNLDPCTSLLGFYRPFPTSAPCYISRAEVHDSCIRHTELLFPTLQVPQVLFIHYLKILPLPTFHYTSSFLFLLGTWLFSVSQISSQFSNTKQRKASLRCKNC
jgi:hypothetical protein